MLLYSIPGHSSISPINAMQFFLTYHLNQAGRSSTQFAGSILNRTLNLRARQYTASPMMGRNAVVTIAFLPRFLLPLFFPGSTTLLMHLGTRALAVPGPVFYSGSRTSLTRHCDGDGSTEFRERHLHPPSPHSFHVFYLSDNLNIGGVLASAMVVPHQGTDPLEMLLFFSLSARTPNTRQNAHSSRLPDVPRAARVHVGFAMSTRKRCPPTSPKSPQNPKD